MKIPIIIIISVREILKFLKFGTTLDYYIYNTSEVIRVDVSDHFVVFITLAPLLRRNVSKRIHSTEKFCSANIKILLI